MSASSRTGRGDGAVSPTGVFQLFSLLVVLLLVAGCTDMVGVGGEGSATPVEVDLSGVEHDIGGGLVGLLESGDRASYAEEHGLDLNGSRVEVAFTLRSGADVPPGHDVEVLERNGPVVHAYVPVSEVPGLASEGEVVFVRRPIR